MCKPPPSAEEGVAWSRGGTRADTEERAKEHGGRTWRTWPATAVDT
jgi:hypothetical protein